MYYIMNSTTENYPGTIFSIHVKLQRLISNFSEKQFTLGNIRFEFHGINVLRIARVRPCISEFPNGVRFTKPKVIVAARITVPTAGGTAGACDPGS